MNFTEKDLDNLSALARINIAPEEKEEMLKSMQSILGYVSEINEVSGATQIIKEEVINVMREDIVTRDDKAKELILENAPQREGDYVKVTQVLS
jgi:aspartyl/glutamyl-tRNA(Asn/Gln) amidotransferase C subunit